MNCSTCGAGIYRGQRNSSVIGTALPLYLFRQTMNRFPLFPRGEGFLRELLRQKVAGKRKGLDILKLSFVWAVVCTHIFYVCIGHRAYSVYQVRLIYVFLSESIKNSFVGWIRWSCYRPYTMNCTIYKIAEKGKTYFIRRWCENSTNSIFSRII